MIHDNNVSSDGQARKSMMEQTRNILVHNNTEMYASRQLLGVCMDNFRELLTSTPSRW